MSTTEDTPPPVHLMQREDVLGPKPTQEPDADPKLTDNAPEAHPHAPPEKPLPVKKRPDSPRPSSQDPLALLSINRLSGQTAPLELSPELCKWKPSVVLDGTKAILRIRNNQPFQVDHTLRIIFTSCKLRRIERSVTYSTFMSDARETTVVVDSGSPHHRFIPVLLAATGGVVYTREGIAHVLVAGAGEVTRSKVSAPSLPSKACNKFSTVNVWSNVLPEDQLPTRNQVVFPWNLEVSVTRNNTTGGLLLVRVDESVFRYKIGRGVVGNGSPLTSSPREDELPSESVEFADGRALMWTVGVTFLMTHSMYCYKRVLGASGHGIIWVENPRQSTAGGTSPQHNV